MSIEKIARAVAAEWQMSFDGIELDFALEVAKRAVEAEREACAKECEAEAALWRKEQDVSDFRLCAERIRARSNIIVTGLAPAQENDK
ncbi:MAG TPA: hypothetical protein VFH31_05390 [Pyrinomonadaceae bacterium]|nr:hypothetical protein [Pyrinomonadaceae bacterium]